MTPTDGVQATKQLNPIAPPFSGRRFKQHPFRLPTQRALAGLSIVQPLWYPIYNAPAGGLAANQSDEQSYNLAIDFWWLATMGNGVINGYAPFTVQLYRNVEDAQGDQQTFAFQFSPIVSDIEAGSFTVQTRNPVLQAQANSAFYLPEPVFFPAGSQLVCSVQNGPAAGNGIQVVLFGATEGA